MTAGSKIKNIHDLLNEYKERIKNNRDQGTIFERLIKSYLENDPLYSDLYANVWLWSDWPLRWGPDSGIDIVAEDKDGQFTAIQCKFFSPEQLVKKEDIDSFFNESGKTFKVDGKRKSFAQRLIVSTSDLWSEPAEKSLHGQTIDVHRIGIHDLANSPIDWSRYSLDKPEKIVLREKKKVRPHQKEAISNVLNGFKKADRGKLIMACGTGKTFTALRLAEEVAKNKGNILFLVPSISLLSQTLREWTAEAESPFHALAVCSDTKVGKHSEDISRHDLAIPATTDAPALIAAIQRLKSDKRMTVVFSTYQSIKVVGDAQKKGLPEFDLIVCDEAHRTTGVTISDQEESHFVKVHDQSFIKGKKRLYMTATPRIYGEGAKTKANEGGAELCSMDDENIYGPEFHRLGFGVAVSNGLLADYKVLVLAVDERHISKTFQNKMTNEDGEIPFDDIVKIIGCWNGLAKKLLDDEAKVEDPRPMSRAVAFARMIKDSKHIANTFQAVVSEYIAKNTGNDKILNCELQHVDGTFNVLDRNARLDWLKADAPENTCRILTNARCLSEGVDVPALDAVLFLNPRDSIVDVVQSVGRIMRQAPGKKYGYVILPIGIPAGVAPEEALKDNKKYKVVWQVLQALRAHDDRFNATINQIELNKKRPSQIQVIGVGGDPSEDQGAGTGKGKSKLTQLALNLPEIEEWKDAIYARLVLKCGSRPYWEQWAADVAKIAEKHIEHIKALLASKNSKARKAFERFLEGMRMNINPSISEDEAIEMLSQHLVTRPVFDALFEHYAFTEMNPVSKAMQGVLDELESNSLKQDTAKLKAFYDSVRMRVKGVDNPEGRQRIIVELYDKFFKVAFPKMSERLGIVYTPVEVVDFIIQSVEVALREQLKIGLTDKGVHILDPFTGTGTFIVRLLQSGLIRPEDLKRKYQNELHANEIVLLAYYIAAINIEETYHGNVGGEYKPFEGVVLTDTFQLSETEAQGTFGDILPENNARVKKQKKTAIQVIVGNPPYSVGQRDGNDNNQNIEYADLDSRIRETYAKESSATLKTSLYDSYVRGIRWASDRIQDKGIIGFVTNGAFITSNSADGLRKTLAREFSCIYCFNLRGDTRTQGEERRKEKGNVFGEGTRIPVAITILIKNPTHKGDAKVHFHDIGDYLSREEKLKIVQDFHSIRNVPWQTLAPNSEGDWVNQRNDEFGEFLELGSKEDSSNSIFSIHSAGVKTNRDPWVYNFSSRTVETKMRGMVAFYNEEVKRFQKRTSRSGKIGKISVEDFVNSDPLKIKWTRELLADVNKGKEHPFERNSIVLSHYRPFTKHKLYFNRRFNNTVYKIPSLFPTPEHNNVLISIIGVVDRKGFSTFITDAVPDLHLTDTGQCFPLFYYEKISDSPELIPSGDSTKPDKHGFVRRDAITDYSWKKFQDTYSDQKISKEDIFYYIYGVLHSPMYRKRYLNDLKKMLPRIPLSKDFWGLSKKGRELAGWHLNYEAVKPYPLKEEVENSSREPSGLYRVPDMVFAKNGKETDKSTIIYNQHIRLSGIPLDAYEYVVNGKPAIEWVMERYAVTTDKESGIKNDPNEWSDDPRYIIDLVKRVVRVSVETNRIVKELPPLEILKES